MKRDRALVAFLAIFLILIANPSLSSIPAARGIESNEKPFFAAADGDESSESIMSFSETSDDDTLTVMDSDNLDTFRDVTDYSYSDDCTDAARWYSDDDWDNFESSGGQLYMNFTGTDVNSEVDRKNDNIDITPFTPSGFKIWMRFKWSSTDATPVLVVGVWNKTSHADQDYWTLSGYDENVWNTITGDFVDLTVATEIVILTSSISETKFIEAWFEYIVIDAPTRVEDSSSVYAEAFADVSDWTTSDVSISTDGDVATITENGAGDNGIAYYTFPVTQDFVGYYYEVRATVESGAGWKLKYYDSSASWWYDFFYTVDSGTRKGIITSAGNDIDRIGIYVTGEGKWVKPDYLRIGPADEMGWQHDGSTTAGVEDDGNTHFDYYMSSDGDILNLTSVRNNATAVDVSADFHFYYDTTSTKTDLETDYYMFFEMRYKTTFCYAYLYADGKQTYKQLTGDNEWHTVRINLYPGTGTALANVKLNVDYTSALGRTKSTFIEWMKFYSIANWSITQSGAGTDDYLYVEDGVLYSSIDDGYIVLDHDPALSVSDTYSVYNLTTPSTAPEFSQYVSEWSAYSDETRGATTSGTVTDIKLKFDSTEILSAIKFIEDGTAPDILDKFIGPPEPDDSEAVTITAVTYDAVEVYDVTINAVVYPTGFSDVDYEMTEQTEDVLWSYEFSTLTAGYYLFQVIANDGANTYSEYIPITVRVSAITITTYTLIGASSDFDYMHYSFHISHDCTFVIEEWSDSWAKNETHTGSVPEGDRAIAWDKIGVNDINANYTITFTSGSLTKVIDGGYLTAYKALQVTEIDFLNLEQSDNWATNLTINFYVNKEVDWAVYDVDNDDAVLHSGTTTEGDGFITWVKNNARGAHQFAVKWTDGVSDQWYNNSYWIYERNIDDLPGGADPGADQRRTIEFWSTISAFVSIAGLIVLGAMYYGQGERLKALQLPKYKTQEG